MGGKECKEAKVAKIAKKEAKVAKLAKNAKRQRIRGWQRGKGCLMFCKVEYLSD